MLLIQGEYSTWKTDVGPHLCESTLGQTFSFLRFSFIIVIISAKHRHIHILLPHMCGT